MNSYLIQNGRVISPGKFQGQPDWMLDLWDMILEGQSDVSLHDGSTVFDAFELDEDIGSLTNLGPRKGWYIVIWSSDDGKINQMTMDKAALDAIESPAESFEDFEDIPTKEWYDPHMCIGFDDHPEHDLTGDA